MWAKKDKLEAMAIEEFTTICKPLKQKNYDPMPKKKKELIAKYKEWHGRPPPSFDISDISVMPMLQRETDGNNDIDDDLDNEIITEAV